MLKGDAALHATRQLGGLVRQRIGLHLGLIEQVEHALGARQRALQRVKGKRQLRHGLGRLIDKLEERLEHADGHMPGNQHAAAHKRNNDLRQTADKAHCGADSIDHKVGLGAHTSQFLRSLVHLSGALTFAVKRADHQTARIAFLDRTRNLGHPLLALARHIVCAARDDLRHQQRQCRKEQKDERKLHAEHEHHAHSTNNRADRHEQLQQSALHALGHLVQVVGRAADDLAGTMRVKIGERQTVELLRDAVAQAQIEAFGHARHQKALERVERSGGRPNQKVDEDSPAAVLPGDAEGGVVDKRYLNVAPQLIDHAGAICRRGSVKDDIEHNAREHDIEAPMVADSLTPQAAHSRPGIPRRLVLVFVVHVAHTLCLGAGALVLGTFVFLVERLAASLALGCSLGGVIQLGRRGSRFLDQSRGSGVINAALLLELLGHATHLPSSAIPRWRGTPRRFP